MNLLRDLRMLGAAEALTNEASVKRAARALGVEPDTLRKEIRDLEQRAGVPLFSFDGDSAFTTAAGSEFLDSARDTLFKAPMAVAIARAAAVGVRDVVRLGKTPYTDPEIIVTLLRLRLPSFPSFHMEVFSDFSMELQTAVKRGDLDLAVVANPQPSEELSTISISSIPFYVAGLPSTTVTGSKEVQLRDLAQDRWILFERKVHPGMYDDIMRRAEEEGIRVNFGPHVITPEEAFQFVSRGLGIAFLNLPSAQLLSNRGIPVRALSDPQLAVHVHLMWNNVSPPPVVRELVREAIHCLPQTTLKRNGVGFAAARKNTSAACIFLKEGDHDATLQISAIEWMQAEDYYVALYSGGRKHLTRESLDSLTRRMNSDLFVRVHRGAAVNVAFVSEIPRATAGHASVRLRDGTTLKLSRRRRTEVIAAIRAHQLR